MTTRALLLALVSLALALPVQTRTIGQEQERGSGQNGRFDNNDGVRSRHQIEPTAGAWKPWVISAGKDYRVPPPPGPAATRRELETLEDLIRQNDATTRRQIAFWDAGAPAYRWMDLINQRAFAGQPLTPFAHRVYAYVALAMNDATIATWDSKYYYRRPRPSEVDHDVATAAAVPNSPSYPSEHSATAWAAATVLSYLLPAEAATFQAMAGEAGRSRVLAGLQYPSDDDAGAELGRRVAQAVIAHAQTDGSALPPVGPRLTGPCNWVGGTPGNFGAQNGSPCC